jgi:enterobactin synthetase component D
MNKRKAEFLAGRFCAQQALNRLGLSPLPIPIGQHRAPMWPAGVCGAITHHQDPQQATALCAVSRDAIGVGIDLESTFDAAQAATLAPNIINQTEQALIMRLGLSDAFATWLTFIFSAKETLFKALYPLVGFYFDFLDVELSRINLHQQYMVLSLKQDLTATLTRGRHFVVHYQRVNSQVLTHMEHFTNPESAIQFRLKSLGS